MAADAPTLENNAPAGGNAARETLIEFPDNNLLQELCGGFDRNLAQIEASLSIQILRRGNMLSVHGPEDSRDAGVRVLETLYARLEGKLPVEPGDIDAALRFGTAAPDDNAKQSQMEMFKGNGLAIRTRKKVVEPRTKLQAEYMRLLFDRELVFGLGPAGTGKTYLAVAAAVSMFLEGRVDRILLSRPAVEAGERLGFLPGDMKEKVDPYMQPLYDALNDLIPAKQVQRYIEEKRIEIAPLAFMRGRTLANAFVVLDEAQNATEMQMKMFLTRLGEGGRMAVTGDLSQIDLPRGVRSGLAQATRVLKGVKGSGQVQFTGEDVVRHPLVARIVKAYDADSERERKAVAERRAAKMAAEVESRLAAALEAGEEEAARTPTGAELDSGAASGNETT